MRQENYAAFSITELHAIIEKWEPTFTNTLLE
jgi:hypothetical protein